MEEGTIVKWRVAEGDSIAVGDVIFEAETDKAVVEVEALDAGRLAKIVVQEGQTVPVKTPVAYLADKDEDVEAHLAAKGQSAAPAAKAPAPDASAQAAPQPQKTPAAPAPTGATKASPAARKLARQRGVDLSAVGTGSGPGGRILSTDVPTAAGPPAPSPAPTPAPARQTTAVGEAVRRPMTPMRKAIARNLQTSKQTIPHFYIRVTIEAGALYDYYQAKKAAFKCSINDVVTLATARVIAEFPAFRSRIDGDDIIEFPSANVGIAVGLDEGLVVPVLVGADAMDLRELAGQTRRIVEAARAGKIEGLGQGVFTITNMGMFGVEAFDAIINPPEAGILAVGTIREEVIVSGGAMRPGRVMTLTLSCDHRIVDGVVAAKFLARLKELLEMPQLLEA